MMVVVVSSDGSSGTSSQYQIQNKLGGFWHNLQIPTKYLCRAEKWGQIQHFIGERNDTPHLIWGETCRMFYSRRSSNPFYLSIIISEYKIE